MEPSQDGQSYDTIIIGCGMSGLAAGIRLAMFDRRVLILERHNAPGGLNSFYFQAGRKFDVGLHAVTNYVEASVKGTPLAKAFRQLRIPRAEIPLCPQVGSRIAFPGVDLLFENGIEVLEAEVARVFPLQIDAFRKLRTAVNQFEALDLEAESVSAREFIRSHLSDPLLEDMLFCPLMYYGSAREHDMDMDQFATLWQAVYEEGFGRPLEGVRVIIKALVDKYRSLGGERRMRCGVKRILVDGNRAIGVELDSGQKIAAQQIISTAGSQETMTLCGASRDNPEIRKAIGRLSFVELIHVLSTPPVQLGAGETIVFFNDSKRFHYEQSENPVDLRSGVICVPNNYRYPQGQDLPEGLLRITMLASHAHWTGLEEDAYRCQKADFQKRILESALRFLPKVYPEAIHSHTVHTDMFTPRTVEKFTSHFGGAVYGSTRKSRTGETAYENLYLAGTDQGFLGIVGAMLSGISMANRHVLMRSG